MHARTSRPLPAVLGVASLAVLLGAARPASADDTIKHPGDHPKYAVEIEPHGVFGWTHYDYAPTDGFGIGARFSIPIVDNGFVKSINDSVAIGFGVDWLHYTGTGCYYYYGPHGPNGCYSVGDGNFLFFPVVMQWNFFVARQWSVFGEPGLVIWHGWFDWCNGAMNCANPSTTGVDFAMYLGGRFHFNETVALTMRIGYPTFSIGASFM